MPLLRRAVRRSTDPPYGSASPRVIRLMGPPLRAIETAIENHSALRVVYHGGSQPGAVREITPIAILGDRIRARCHASGKAKIFVLARMELSGRAVSNYELGHERPPDFQSIAVVDGFARDTLEGMGLDVQYSATDRSERLAVHRRWKNGKPLKGPEVELQFDPILRESVIDVDDDGELIEREATRASERPYFIRAKSGYSARFVSLDRAAKKFLELVDCAKR